MCAHISLQCVVNNIHQRWCHSVKACLSCAFFSLCLEKWNLVCPLYVHGCLTGTWVTDIETGTRVLDPITRPTASVLKSCQNFGLSHIWQKWPNAEPAGAGASVDERACMDSVVYLHSNFCGGLRKTHGPSRSSKVVDFGTNWKRVCDFLLVVNSKLGPLLSCFRDIAGFLRKLTPPVSPEF